MSLAWISSPRWRIALTALAVVLLLDLGRSILARQAMSEPVTVWKPDPAVYSDTPWPPSAGAPADATLSLIARSATGRTGAATARPRPR